MTLNMPVDKQSAVYQQSLVKSARSTLLTAVLFTMLNIVLLLVGSNRYFLFSATIPYYLTFFGYMFDYFTVGTYTLTGLTMALIPLAALGFCWYCSKADSRWLKVAAVLFGVDVLAMLGLMLWSGDMSSSLLDIVFHGWVEICLIRGIKADNRLKVMEGAKATQLEIPVEEEMAVEEELQAAEVEAVESQTAEEEVVETDTDCPV